MSALNPRNQKRKARTTKVKLSQVTKKLSSRVNKTQQQPALRPFAKITVFFPFYCCRVSMCVWLDTRFASARCVCIWFGIAQLCTGTTFVLAGAVSKKWARSASRAAREASVAIQNGATDCTHLTPILTSTQPPVHAVADSPKWQVQGPHQGKHQS